MQSSPTCPCGSGVSSSILENYVVTFANGEPIVIGSPGTQTLPARIGARLGRSIRVDDLSPVSRPRFDESIRKRLAGRNDVSAYGVRKIRRGIRGQRREQNGRAKENRDFSFAKNVDELGSRPDLIFG
jgi:hypothetical protein